MRANKNKNKKSAKKEKDQKALDDVNSGWKGVCRRFWKRNYVYIIMILLVAMRIALGYMMGAWYGDNQICDDVAMMKGLSLDRLTHPDRLSLIKDLNYSVFLGINAVSNLPYTVVLSGYWVLTAFATWILAGKFTKNKWLKLAVFSYVLFLPIAFTSWGGLRIYRNGVIAPSIILTFSSMLIMMINIARREKIKRTIWSAVFAGVAFAFTYFLKEDGVWLMVCMIFALVVMGIVIIYRLVKEKPIRYKQAVVAGAICLIPLGVWFVWNNVYRGVNHAFFGVYEINTRTEGELGKFVYNIYKIESPNRSEVIWAPYDAIERAFEVSPTLGSHPELLERIKKSPWNDGDTIKNPIERDFLTWVMRDALVEAGLWTTEEEINDMFLQVNRELDEAFSNGTLEKAKGRIQLLASTGGYTVEEIKNSNLLEQMGAAFGDALWFNNYHIGITENGSANGVARDYGKVEKIVHMRGELNMINQKKQQIAENAVQIVCAVYRIVNTILIVALPVLVIGETVGLIRGRKNIKEYVRRNGLNLILMMISVVMLSITTVYNFATAWFFIAPAGSLGAAPEVFVFYRVGVPALMTMSLMPAMVGAAKRGKDLWNKMKEGK